MENPTQPRRYDCNRTMDFVRENSRMCRTYHDCIGCELEDSVCQAPLPNITPDHTQHIIDVTQAWSDANPEEAPHA